jgi:cysteine-rich repeat protein
MVLSVFQWNYRTDKWRGTDMSQIPRQETALLRRALWSLILASILTSTFSHCSSSRIIGDSESDATDSLEDRPSSTDILDADIPSHEYSPQCGNGVLDEGEECDDHNRLNGDGCDWLCRIGDGDPPPDPDPGILAFSPDGDPIEIASASDWGNFYMRVPLVWTGSEYATAFLIESGDDYQVHFRRFDRNGTTIGDIWRYEIWSDLLGLDLSWTGRGFGLFFADDDIGIKLLLLDEEGKPISEPIVVVDDNTARAPAVDIYDDQYILSWITEGLGYGTSWCTIDDHPDTIQVRILELNGNSTGLPGPIIIEANAGGPPDVAAGEGGFGISMLSNGSEEHPYCSHKFMQVSSDLSSVRHSGTLSIGFSGDVGWDGARYTTTWSHSPIDSTDNWGTCVARFNRSGDLESAPVCSHVPYAEIGVSRFDFGDGGLGILNSNMDQLLFLRTDALGAAVAEYESLIEAGTGSLVGPYAIAWADTHFGTVYMNGPTTYFLRLISE